MAYADIIIADTPYAYYRLGESSGTTADNAEGTSARDGTYVNTPTLAVTGALEGDADTAITLASASSEYVDVPLTALDTAILAAGAITFECWLKTTQTGIVNLYGQRTGNPFIFFRINSNSGGGTTNGSVEFNIRGDNAGHIINGATSGSVGINDGAWHHVVIAVNLTSATGLIYVDGVSRAVTHGTQVTPAAMTITNNGDIGAVNSSGAHSAYFNGSLDEVAIYASVLTAAQVREHYAAGLGIIAGGGAASLIGTGLIR